MSASMPPRPQRRRRPAARGVSPSLRLKVPGAARRLAGAEETAACSVRKCSCVVCRVLCPRRTPARRRPDAVSGNLAAHGEPDGNAPRQKLPPPARLGRGRGSPSRSLAKKIPLQTIYLATRPPLAWVCYANARSEPPGKQEMTRTLRAALAAACVLALAAPAAARIKDLASFAGSARTS
jgi:hypothetical protein